MTALKNIKDIKAFQRYVGFILDQFMNNVCDEQNDFEDSPFWNITVVYQKNDLKLNRISSEITLNVMAKTPAFTDVYSGEIHTPSVSLLEATERNFDVNNYWHQLSYGIRELHMTPYQTVELCKTILFDMINSYPEHGYSFSCGGVVDYIPNLDTNCKMFAFLAHYYATGYNTSEPELYDRAMRLVKSLNKKYVELMTL